MYIVITYTCVVRLVHFSFMFSHAPLYTLFPYTTLFRSAIFIWRCIGLRHWRHKRTTADYRSALAALPKPWRRKRSASCANRSEEHTSELQSRGQHVCRLLLEYKKC